MSWFYLVFSIAMIASPLLFVLLFRPRLKTVTDDAAALARVGRLTMVLWFATLVAVIVALVARQYLLPPLAMQVWICFFPLWFGLAMPIINTKYPSLSSPYAKGPNDDDVPTRSASLSRRDTNVSISPVAWLLPWGVWLVGAVAVAWSIGHAGDDVHPALYLSPVIFPFMTAILLASGPWCLRMLAREAEPLDTAGSAELAEGYRALRQFRVRGMYWLMFVGFAATSTAMACATAWGVSGPTMGITGGVLGTLVGCAGGAFGTIAGIRRARLTEMLQRLSTEQAEATS